MLLRLLRKLLIVCMLLGGCWTRAMFMPSAVPAKGVRYSADLLRQRTPLVSFVFGLSAVVVGLAAKYCWNKSTYWVGERNKSKPHCGVFSLWDGGIIDIGQKVKFWGEMTGTSCIMSGMLGLASLIFAVKAYRLRN